MRTLIDRSQPRQTSRVRESFTLSMVGGSIHVTTDRPRSASWLREVLRPGFSLDDGSQVVAHVSIGGPEFALEHRDGFDDRGMVPCFALDGEVVGLPGHG